MDEESRTCVSFNYFQLSVFYVTHAFKVLGVLEHEEVINIKQGVVKYPELKVMECLINFQSFKPR